MGRSHSGVPEDPILLGGVTPCRLANMQTFRGGLVIPCSGSGGRLDTA